MNNRLKWKNKKGRENGSKKNIFLWPHLSLPCSELQPICLLRKSSNISRKVSGPAGTVESAQTGIWSYSSLYLLPKSTAAATAKSLQSTIAPKVHNCHQSPQPQANCGDLTCCTCSYRSEFPFSSLVTQLLMFSIGFGPISVCRPHCIVCSQPRQWKSLSHVRLFCDPIDCTVHGILKARILEWVASSLLQRILPTQGSNPCLLHCRQILYQLSDQGSKCSSYTGLTCSVGLGSRRGTPDIAGMCEECLW